MSAKNKSKKSAPSARWNLIHERWELKSNSIWIKHPDRQGERKWTTVREFVECWKHETAKSDGKGSVANLSKKWRTSISGIKKQRTTINNAAREAFPNQKNVGLKPLPDYTAQQIISKRSQSNELTKENLADLLGIKTFDT